MPKKFSPTKPETSGGLKRVYTNVPSEIYSQMVKLRLKDESEARQVARMIEASLDPHRWCTSLPEYQSKTLDSLRSSAPYNPTREQFIRQIVDDYIAAKEARIKEKGDPDA